MRLPSSLGHLTDIEVTGLFGSRKVSFELDLKEPTLLTGTNGSGKSTILKIINAIGNGQWARLDLIPFKSLNLSFENDVSLHVTKGESGLAVVINGELYNIPTGTAIEIDSWSEEEIQAVFPGVQYSRAGFYDYQDQLLDRGELAARLRADGKLILNKDQAELGRFVRSFPILYITDQRLVVSEDRRRSSRARPPLKRMPSTTAAELSASELSRLMRETLSIYASSSQRRDRDFPHRVVQAMRRQQEFTVEDIETGLKEVEKVRAALQAVGLAPKDLESSLFQELYLDDASVRPVIATFVEDTKAKFNELADLQERLTLFSEFLNQHYENKEVVTNKEHGFDVKIEDSGTSRTISVSELSSGEQQILVLAYEVLFKTEPETLVLIDEPELSLHVLWQDSFVDDLTKMGSARNLQFILATHSPSLIGGREDLKRSLDRRV